ncbi:MAG: oligoendopeptidase F [Aestuariibacter sp.]
MKKILPLLFACAVALPAAASDTPDNQIKWNLTHLYQSNDAWDAERQQVAANIDKLDRFKGELANSAESLQLALDEMSAVMKDLYRVYSYASLMADEDTRVAANQERRALALNLWSSYQQKTAYVEPELIAAGEAKINEFLAANTGLEKHSFYLEGLVRREPHTLGDQAEQVLAQASPVLSGPGNTYQLLANSDMPWPEIDIDGEKVTLNQSMYGKYRGVGNRDTRKRVMDAFFGKLAEYESTMGSLIDTHVKSHVFNAKARDYENSLDAAVSGPNIPQDVYKTLVKSANKHLPALHRYLKIRQKLLGLNDLHYYDIYPPIVSSDKKFTIEEAEQLTLESLQPFGERYLSELKKVIDSDWLHVYPQPGKRSGAYMLGIAYDENPYVLLNFNGNFDDVSTYTHELGHAVHTLLARQEQPFEKAFYSTFTAELASTTNSVLLEEYMLEKDLSKQERIFYLGEALEGIRGTFFRQTQFAEFELAIHEVVERGEALSGSKASDIYLDLLKKYYGHEKGVMNIDPLYAIEWAYIPHFYSNFYVYQYATSITGGTAFAEKILAGKTEARDAYINVLAAGGSEFPYQLLADNGIDLADEKTYDLLIARMNRLMDEIELLLD